MEGRVLNVPVHESVLPEFYRMVEFWCREHSNTFCGVRDSLARAYPDMAGKINTELENSFA